MRTGLNGPQLRSSSTLDHPPEEVDLGATTHELIVILLLPPSYISSDPILGANSQKYVLLQILLLNGTFFVLKLIKKDHLAIFAP